MSPLVAAAIYFILWWLCFFVMLPVGVRNLDEAGVTDARGHDRGAPVAPNLRQKALWAAGLALVVWAILLAVLHVIYYSA
jgi:predicted secreted protein